MLRVDVKASCEKIKTRCEELKLSAKQLQETLSVEVTAPYVWLTGRGLPKLETLMNLCQLLQCSVEELIVTYEATSENNMEGENIDGCEDGRLD